MAGWGSFFSRNRTSERPATPAAREREVNAGLRKALFALLEHDYPRAEQGLSEAVRADSDAVECYLALAGFYRERGEIGRAIRVHQNLLLRRNPSSGERAEVLSELARDFERGGFLRRAVASYEEVLAYDPRRRDALNALVTLYASLREYPEAVKIHKRLERVERQNDPVREAELHVEMAEFAHQSGRSKDAAKAAKLALRRDPRCVRAQILLGELEVERGRDKAALVAWKKVPEMDLAAAAEIYPRLEAAFASLGKVAEYETFLRDLLREHEGDLGASLALAETLANRGDADAALQKLRETVGANPSDLRARLVLGRRLVEVEGADEGADEVAKEYSQLLEILESRMALAGRSESLDEALANHEVLE